MKGIVLDAMRSSSERISDATVSLMGNMYEKGITYPLDQLFYAIGVYSNRIAGLISSILNVPFLVNMIIILSSIAVVLGAYLKYLSKTN